MSLTGTGPAIVVPKGAGAILGAAITSDGGFYTLASGFVGTVPMATVLWDSSSYTSPNVNELTVPASDAGNFIVVSSITALVDPAPSSGTLQLDVIAAGYTVTQFSIDWREFADASQVTTGRSFALPVVLAGSDTVYVSAYNLLNQRVAWGGPSTGIGGDVSLAIFKVG